jgi:hypothetical protein
MQADPESQVRPRNRPRRHARPPRKRPQHCCSASASRAHRHQGARLPHDGRRKPKAPAPKGGAIRGHAVAGRSTTPGTSICVIAVARQPDSGLRQHAFIAHWRFPEVLWHLRSPATNHRTLGMSKPCAGQTCSSGVPPEAPLGLGLGGPRRRSRSAHGGGGRTLSRVRCAMHSKSSRGGPGPPGREAEDLSASARSPVPQFLGIEDYPHILDPVACDVEG